MSLTMKGLEVLAPFPDAQNELLNNICRMYVDELPREEGAGFFHVIVGARF